MEKNKNEENFFVIESFASFNLEYVLNRYCLRFVVDVFEERRRKSISVIC